MNMNDYIPIEENVIIQSDPYFGPATRSLYLSGPIDYNNTKKIISEILQLNSMSSKEIKLYINTEGGSLTDAFAIYDVIKTIKSPVVTIAQGLCASAGLIIFLSGIKRYASENSMFFYHQPIIRTTEINSSQYSEDLSEAYSISRNLLNKIIKNTADIAISDWNHFFENKTFKYFTAEKMKSFNIVTHVIKNKRI